MLRRVASEENTMTDTTDKPLGQLVDERRLRLLQRLQDAHRLDVRTDDDGTWVGTCACGWVSRNPSVDGIREDYPRHLCGIAERMMETRATDFSVPGRPVTLPDATEILREQFVETVQNGTEGLPPEFRVTLHHGREVAREVAATGIGQGYKTTTESPPCEMLASQRTNRLRKQLGTEPAPETMPPIAAVLQELHDMHRALGQRLDVRMLNDPADRHGQASIRGKMKGIGIAITLLQPHAKRERQRNADPKA